MLQESFLTKKPNRVSRLSLSLAVFSILLMPLTAHAQRQTDPNIGHFYMARQQVSITDDSPVINNRVNGGAAPGAQMPGNGALPAGPMPLAPARWQSFAPPPTAPSLSTSLPQVNKGLPTKGAMPGTGNRGNTGRLPGKGGRGGGGSNPAATISKPSVPVAAGYTPYKKFAVEAPAATSIGNGANGKVYGDVLHWAHQHH